MKVRRHGAESGSTAKVLADVFAVVAAKVAAGLLVAPATVVAVDTVVLAIVEGRFESRMNHAAIRARKRHERRRIADQPLVGEPSPARGCTQLKWRSFVTRPFKYDGSHRSVAAKTACMADPFSGHSRTTELPPHVVDNLGVN